MNKAILMGRLARDPELRATQSGLSVCNFTVACDKRIKNQAGEYENTADFIDCVAWRGQADLIAKYFQKGSRILVMGSLQTRSWEDDSGQKRYKTEVLVQEVEFCESAQGGQSQGTQNRGTQKNHYDLPDDDTGLPFEW